MDGSNNGSLNSAHPAVGQRRLKPILWLITSFIFVSLLWVFVPRMMDFSLEASASPAVQVLETRTANMEEPTKTAAILVATTFKQFRTASRMWSGVYNGFALSASALGLLAALVLKLDTLSAWDSLRKDAAAILAASGAVLAALSTTGDFQMKWQSNRAAAAEVEALAFSMLSTTPPETTEIIGRLREIARERHLKLIGVKLDTNTSSRISEHSQAQTQKDQKSEPSASR
jgi:hypothetical protein